MWYGSQPLALKVPALVAASSSTLELPHTQRQHSLSLAGPVCA